MKRTTYYWTCPYCKANLDLDERCDCQDVTIAEQQQPNQETAA